MIVQLKLLLQHYYASAASLLYYTVVHHTMNFRVESTQHVTLITYLHVGCTVFISFLSSTLQIVHMITINYVFVIFLSLAGMYVKPWVFYFLTGNFSNDFSGFFAFVYPGYVIYVGIDKYESKFFHYHGNHKYFAL